MEVGADRHLPSSPRQNVAAPSLLSSQTDRNGTLSDFVPSANQPPATLVNNNNTSTRKLLALRLFDARKHLSNSGFSPRLLEDSPIIAPPHSPRLREDSMNNGGRPLSPRLREDSMNNGRPIAPRLREDSMNNGGRPISPRLRGDSISSGGERVSNFVTMEEGGEVASTPLLSPATRYYKTTLPLYQLQRKTSPLSQT